MSLPWSVKGSKASPGVAADELMILDSQDPTAATKNKRMTYQNLADSLLDLSSIAGLTDGQTTILSTSLVAFEQGGSKFKASMRPNPPRQINVTSQAQLEEEFGADIQIPDNESFLISIDESFTLTKPIKLGLDSALRVAGSVSSITLTYTGSGAMFQNTVSTDLIDSFDIRLIRIAGNFTNNAFDLVGKLNSVCIFDTVQIVQFDDIGLIEMDFFSINGLGLFTNNQGFTIKDAEALSINVVIINQTGLGDTGMTAFSFIQGTPSLLILDDIRAGPGFSTAESIVFFDPNAPAGTSFVITNATKIAGNLFQPGTDINIGSVADNGSGDTRFTMAQNTAHELVVGKVVRILNFGVQTQYNGTFVVTAVDTPLTGITFDVDEVFVADDTGTMSAKSLDSKDVLVSAFNNPGEPNSMSQAEGVNGNTISFSSIIDTFVPFENTSPAPGDFIQDPITERFTIDTSTGIMTYIGIEPITNIVEFNFDIAKTGGGTNNIVTSLFQNAVQISKTDKSIAVTSTATTIAVGTLLAIQPGDTFQIKMDSAAVSVINITNWRILTRN